MKTCPKCKLPMHYFGTYFWCSYCGFEEKIEKIYISSAMTGKPNFNMEAFFAKAEELKKRGFTVLNPAENSVKYGFNKSYGFYMREAIKMLCEADVMIIFGDWKGSKGVAYERQIAAILDIPVIVE